MTKVKFNLQDKAIIVQVCVEADGMTNDLRFLVDTGTYETLISEEAMVQMGYVRANSNEDVPIKTVTGIAMALRFETERISALGVTRRGMNVISYPMLDDAGIDGLLGLDFFEGTELAVNFNSAEISVYYTKMCHHCSTLNPEYAKFCMECATKFRTPNPTPANQAFPDLIGKTPKSHLSAFMTL